VLVGLAAAAVLVVGLLAFVAPPTTAYILQSATQPVAWEWVPIERVSQHLLLAVIAAEDQRFPEHRGFDFEAIEKAAEHNRRGGSVRGASTITQQVAKNLFLWPGRSYLRKGIEAALTATIELLWTKRRILEVYVNVAEMGDGVFGVHAASQRFFGRSPDSLTREEAALLAAVLPNPRSLRVDRPSPTVLRRRTWILGQMKALGGPEFLKRLDASARRVSSLLNIDATPARSKWFRC
jgi:monofunctional biosynthetic peptidoglycan transglycosylase